jgi:hypothetical protein
MGRAVTFVTCSVSTASLLEDASHPIVLFEIALLNQRADTPRDDHRMIGNVFQM